MLETSGKILAGGEAVCRAAGIPIAGGHTIDSVTRRAKYLLINTDNGSAMIHLGMSGSVYIVDRGTPPSYHEHFDFDLGSGKTLRYRDPRRFGSLHWTDNGIEERDFLSGFLSDSDISGRPVDVAEGPDGIIYISDDYAGAIYRVRYGAGNAAGGAVVTAPARASRLDPVPPDWLAM